MRIRPGIPCDDGCRYRKDTVPVGIQELQEDAPIVTYGAVCSIDRKLVYPVKVLQHVSLSKRLLVTRFLYVQVRDAPSQLNPDKAGLWLGPPSALNHTG